MFLRAADLLAGPWRERLNAATMLGQSKTAYQAEIDTACELIDFWRFNVAFARQILAEQPISSPRRLEPHRLPAARGLRLRDHAVQLHRDRRQPADRARADGQHRGLEAVADPDLAAYLTMQLLEEAGLPPGVINMLTGDGIAVSEVALAHRAWPASTSPARRARSSTCGARSATTSTATTPTRGSSARPAARTSSSRTPRRDPDVLRTALIRGAFEFQGQKCSAASRAYVPRSVWQQMGDDFLVRDRGAALGRRHRPVQLHGRGDRRAGIRQATSRRSSGPRARPA